jgi:F-type H+-transporting ATPase subunit epsilon
MSDKDFILRVVTPEKLYIKDLQVTLVEARGVEGDFGAMPGHEPFLTQLKPGTVSYRLASTGERDDFYCEGGVIEVLPTKVTILAESAEKIAPEDLEAEAEAARREAEELLAKIERLKAEGAKAAPAEKAEQDAERAAYEEQLAQSRQRLEEGKQQLWLEIPPAEGSEDDLARLEIKLRKSLSRTSYIQQKKQIKTK